MASFEQVEASPMTVTFDAPTCYPAVDHGVPSLAPRYDSTWPVPDVSQFRRICCEAACQTHGAILEFRIAEGLTPNFHQALIAYSGRTVVAVLSHRYESLLALAEPHVIELAPTRESGPLTFLRRPDLAAALAQTSKFRMLSAEELDSPFDAAQWPGVSGSDVKYWRPGSLGEALFNYWD